MKQIISNSIRIVSQSVNPVAIEIRISLMHAPNVANMQNSIFISTKNSLKKKEYAFAENAVAS